MDNFNHNILAAFRGMHVLPVKLPRKCDYRTDTQADRLTDADQSDSYVPLCFSGDRKTKSYTFTHTILYILCGNCYMQ